MSSNEEYNEGDYQQSIGDNQDDSIESMREKLEQLTEEERKIQSVSGTSGHANTSEYDPEAAAAADANSIYVGNVDYSVTQADLEAFFSKCGKIVRITLPENSKHTGHKGYAYLEFASDDAVIEATSYDKTELKGRPLTILPKRTNIANFNRGRGGRGGFRGRGRGGRGGQIMPPMFFNMSPAMSNMYMFPMVSPMAMAQPMQTFQPPNMRNNTFNRGRGQGRPTYRPKPYDKQ